MAMRNRQFFSFSRVCNNHHFSAKNLVYGRLFIGAVFFRIGKKTGIFIWFLLFTSYEEI